MSVAVASVERLADPALLVLASLALLLSGLVAWYWWRRARVPTTRLEAAALRLTSEFLLERPEELDTLHTLTLSTPLVFLVGESGVGKSKLMDLFLRPRLAAAHGRLPIYIGAWGRDWERGEAKALDQATRDANPAQVPNPPGLVEWVDVTAAFERLDALAARLNLKPMLLLDQMEDYQAQHFEHFIERGRVKGPSELEASNAFWAELARRLRRGDWTCVLAAQAEAHLRPFRFVEGEEFYLARLPPGRARGVLERLLQAALKSTDSPAPGARMLAPEIARLLDELGRDLDEDNLLPVQMEMAVLGLAHLSRLTVTDYDQGGRLDGLLANHLRIEFSRAAQVAGLSTATAVQGLHALCDPQAKTTPVLPLSALALAAGAKSEQMRIFLNQLEDAHIVRRSLEASRDEAPWRLQHAFLTRPVQRVLSQFELAQTLLDQGLRRFTVVGWRARVRALLGWRELLRVLAGLARRKVRWSWAALTLVGLSVLRLSLFAGAFLFPAWCLSAWIRDQRAANAILDAFDQDEGLTIQEARAVWRLYRSPALHAPFLRRCLDSASNAERCLAHRATLVHAIGGLSGRTAEALRAVVDQQCRSDVGASTEAPVLCAALMAETERSDLHTVARYLEARRLDVALLRLTEALPTSDRPVAGSLLLQGATRWSPCRNDGAALTEALNLTWTDSAAAWRARALTAATAVDWNEAGGLALARLRIARFPPDRDERRQLIGNLPWLAYSSPGASAVASVLALEQLAGDVDPARLGRTVASLPVHSTESGMSESHWALESAAVFAPHLSAAQLPDAVALLAQAATTRHAVHRCRAVDIDLRPLLARLDIKTRQALLARALDAAEQGLPDGDVENVPSLRLLHALLEQAGPDVQRTVVGELLEHGRQPLVDELADGRKFVNPRDPTSLLAYLATRFPEARQEHVAEAVGAAIIATARLGHLEVSRPRALALVHLAPFLSVAQRQELRDILVRELWAHVQVGSQRARRGLDARLLALARAIQSLGGPQDDALARDLLFEVPRGASPFCESVIAVTAPERAPVIVEQVLKWPTCSLEAREVLVAELARVTDSAPDDLGRVIGGRLHWDARRLNAWAHRRGYDAESRARVPSNW